jgi:hypothetical protein
LSAKLQSTILSNGEIVSFLKLGCIGVHSGMMFAAKHDEEEKYTNGTLLQNEWLHRS